MFSGRVLFVARFLISVQFESCFFLQEDIKGV